MVQLMDDYGIQASLAAARGRRDAQNENAARQATSFLKHTTNGAGSIRTGNKAFDVVFLEEPSFVTGLVLETVPDVAHYHLPTVTVGVHKWETAQHPGSNDPKKLIWTGAHLYFRIVCDPLLPVRSDGSNLADLQARLAKVPTGTAGAKDRATLNALIKEAQEAVWLKANPAKVKIVHHVQFQGLALKGPDLPAADAMQGSLTTLNPNFN